MSTLTERTHRVTDVARRLGVTPKTIWWWTSRWDRDHRSDWLTDVDVMVLRAIFVITGGSSSAYTDRDRLHRAVQAIRDKPRRWLYICEDQIETFDDEDRGGAAVMWLARPAPRGLFWLADLWPWEDVTAALTVQRLENARG